MTLQKANATTPATKAPIRKAGIEAATKAPKGGKIAAMAKAHVKAAKAPAPAAPVVDTRIDALADMIRGQQVTIDSLVTQCELLERIIVGIQTARIAAPVAPAAPATKAPTAKAKTDKAPNVERGTYDGPAVDGPVADVLDYLADCIIANEAAGFVNENIMRANPSRMRRYLRTNENKAFKAMREAHDITLTLADDMLDSIFAD